MEIFSSQKVGGEFGDVKFDYKLDHQNRKKIKNIFAESGVKIIAIGVFDIFNTKTLSKDWELVFQFARDMGAEYITSEPPSTDMNLVEKLVKKYNIKVAIHNHQNPSKFWKPDAVLKEIQDKDRRIGCCADVGHWKNSGLNELACIRELQGRIISLHFADILASDPNEKVIPQNVIWGKGVMDIKGILVELKNQNFKGVITIEFEFGEDTTPEIKESISYYNFLTDEIFKNKNTI